MVLATFIELGATSDADPSPPALSPCFPLISPLKEASWQFGWWNTRQRAATHSGRARRRPQLVPTPTQSAQPPGTPPWRALGPHPSPAWGVLGPILPANFYTTSRGPSRVRVPLPPSPESPSLSLHPASPSALPRVGQSSGAARWERGLLERPRSLSPSVSATAVALTPKTELAGTQRLSPLHVPWHLLLRGVGPAT